MSSSVMAKASEYVYFLRRQNLQSVSHSVLLVWLAFPHCPEGVRERLGTPPLSPPTKIWSRREGLDPARRSRSVGVLSPPRVAVGAIPEGATATTAASWTLPHVARRCQRDTPGKPSTLP